MKSIDNWKTTPGNTNALKTNIIFPSDNDLGIPNLRKCTYVPRELADYDTPVKRQYAQVRGKTVHFFIDDYKIEPIWNRPIKTLGPIVNIGKALTPDYSVYMDYPRALQIFNVYRNRWIGRYWQSQGVKVIPSIAWGDKSTFDFCFLGVPKHNSVAVSTVGINDKESRKFYFDGLSAMIETLEPKNLIVYGETCKDSDLYNECDNVVFYPSYWEKKRGELNGR